MHILARLFQKPGNERLRGAGRAYRQGSGAFGRNRQEQARNTLEVPDEASERGCPMSAPSTNPPAAWGLYLGLFPRRHDRQNPAPPLDLLVIDEAVDGGAFLYCASCSTRCLSAAG